MHDIQSAEISQSKMNIAYIHIYIYRERERGKEYFGVHTTDFAGVAFQVCTTDVTIYIKLLERR